MKFSSLSVPAAQFAGTQRLLPNEPTAVVSATQAMLTDRYLLPALVQLEVFFLAVRLSVDPALQRAQPVALGKPYPLGQCLEISLAVQHRLRRAKDLQFDGMAAHGHLAFCAFLKAGGVFRQVWGDLRGEFFQNAFQLGTLYVDVSNDTVTLTKPKVEILPFADARFTPIADFQHFARIAKRYWKGDIFPNHVLPELAPYCPLVHIDPRGLVQLRDATGYMVALAAAGRFLPSEEVLREPAMPPALFADISRALQGQKLNVASSLEAGRTQALRYCHDYRVKRWHRSPKQTAKIIHAALHANQLLGLAQLSATNRRAPLRQLTFTIPQAPLPMPTITFNNVDYDLDTFSQEAKAQLQSIQYVDQELARLQSQLAVMQTARNAYVTALEAALPS